MIPVRVVAAESTNIAAEETHKKYLYLYAKNIAFL